MSGLHHFTRLDFLAGIEHVPQEKVADFVTLTFPRDRAPNEEAAHEALRSLVARLRYRGYLGAYGWVLQRQNNGTGNRLPAEGEEEEAGTLHYHGIFHLPYFEDDLEEWRELVVASGFGPQQKIVPAEPKHAGYVASYISKRLASLNPLRRAFAFSRDFPRSEFALGRMDKDREKALLAELGVSLCSWEPARSIDALLNG